MSEEAGVTNKLRSAVGSVIHRVFPDDSPPRLLLFFIATAVFGLASLIAGLFNNNTAGLHNAAVAICFIALFLLSFAVVFFIATPGTDRRLRPHVKKLLASAKVISIFSILFLVGASIIMIPWLFSYGGNTLFGKLEIPPVTSDHIAITHQANEALLNGENPYTSTNIIAAMEQFPGINPTPLKQGAFTDVYPHPSEEQLSQQLAISMSNPEEPPLEFVSHVSYPSGAFLFRLPFDAAGLNPQLFYLICIAILTIFIARKAPPHLRPLAVAGCLASFLVWLSHFGGATESLFVLFVLLGWTLRRRPWLAPIFIGVAATCKQTAWFFIPFFLILVFWENGWRQAARYLAVICAVFVISNLPFIIADPQSWITGVLAPMIDPLFPYKGVGFSVFATLIDTPMPPLAFTVMEGVVFAGAIAWYYFRCRQAPHAGLLLALVPIFFAWRSKFAYFVMIPLLVFGAVIVEEYRRYRTVKIEPAENASPG
jgi:hypothetical protein